MEPVVIAKILQEALRASWNFSSAHWLHHPMNVKYQILILKKKKKKTLKDKCRIISFGQYTKCMLITKF